MEPGEREDVKNFNKMCMYKENIYSKIKKISINISIRL